MSTTLVDPVQAPAQAAPRSTRSIPPAFDGGDDAPSPYVDPSEFSWEEPGGDNDKPVSEVATDETPEQDSTPPAATAQTQSDKGATERPAEAVAPQPTPKAPAQDHVAEAARYLGLDPAAFGTPEQLSVAVKALDTKLAELGRQSTQAPQHFPQPPMAQPAPQPAPQRQPDPQAEGFKLELDEEYSDPAVVKALKQVREHYDHKFQALEGYFQQQQQAQYEQQRSAYYDNFDKLVAEDAEELGEVLGKGGVSEVSGDALTKRRELLDQMEALRLGYAMSGYTMPTQKSLYHKAKGIVLQDQLKQIATQRVVEQARNHKGQYIARPTQRTGSAHTGEESAVSFARGFFSERAIEVREDSPTDPNFEV